MEDVITLDDLPPRLQARITVSDNGCWIVAVNGEHPYAQIKIGEKRWLVHRFVYTLEHGSIPDGMEIDHLCRVTRCANPAHLEAVTPLENTARSHGNVAKTECPQGHPYTDENTYNSGRRKHRQCRTCVLERQADWRRRNPGYISPSRRK